MPPLTPSSTRRKHSSQPTISINKFINGHKPTNTTWERIQHSTSETKLNIQERTHLAPSTYLQSYTKPQYPHGQFAQTVRVYPTQSANGLIVNCNPLYKHNTPTSRTPQSSNNSWSQWIHYLQTHAFSHMMQFQCIRTSTHNTASIACLNTH